MIMTCYPMMLQFIGGDTSSKNFIFGFFNMANRITTGVIVIFIQFFAPTKVDIN